MEKYGKMITVKESEVHTNGQEKRIEWLQENVARRGARNVALAETRLHRKEQKGLQPKEKAQGQRGVKKNDTKRSTRVD